VRWPGGVGVTGYRYPPELWTAVLTGAELVPIDAGSVYPTSISLTMLAAFIGFGLKPIEYYGAVGDGVTDDSQAVNRSLAQTGAAIFRSDKTYALGNITLSNTQSIIGNGASFVAVAGAAFIFQLTNYAAEVTGVYIANATNCSVAAVVFGSGFGCEFTESWIVNATSCIYLSGGAGNCASPIISNVWCSAYSGTGLFVGPNCSVGRFSNLYLDSNTNLAGNKPKAGAYGVQHITTGSTSAFGGHFYVNVTTINSEYGWIFTDATLTKLVNCIADGHANWGIQIGGASSYIDLLGQYIGTCGGGLRVLGTSLKISVVGLRTILTCYIPPWGVAGFFDFTTPYDLSVENTASVQIDGVSWAGDKRINSPPVGATMVIAGAATINFCSTAGIAAGSTVYFGSGSQQATEGGAVWAAPCAGVLIGFQAYTNYAPGAGQSFTWTLRQNAASISPTAVQSGAASFAASWQGGYNVNAGDQLSLQCVASAGTNASTLARGYVQFVPAVG
jgi:hypothetical protein